MARLLVRLEERRGSCRVLVDITDGTRAFGGPRYRRKYNIEMNS